MILSWKSFKHFIDLRNSSIQWLEADSNYYLKAFDGQFTVDCILNQAINLDDVLDFETNYKANGNKSPMANVQVSSQPTPPAFRSKSVTVNGITKNLYKRHTGIQSPVYAQQTTDIFFTIPYSACKITGASVIGGETLDTINLYVLDTDTNTYSQAPVNVVGPNYKLNQFGFNVNVAKDYFQNTSQYDADLYVGMKIKISYTSKSDKTIGINIDLHEVK